MIIQRPGQKILTIGNPGLQIISPRGGAAWTPASISGLKLWIDFSDATTLFTDAGSTNVSSDGDAIYQANDKSGNGNHVSQATLVYRPLYKTNIQNGLSAFLGDGANNFLARGDALGLTGNPAITVISIVKLEAKDESIICHLGSSAGTGGQCIYYRLDTVSGQASYRFNNGNLIFNNTVSTGAVNLYTFIRDSGDTYADGLLYLNGSSETADSSLNGANTLSLVDQDTEIGAGVSGSGRKYLKGYLMEVLIYNAALGDTDRQAVEAYLNAKWNVY